MQQPPSGTTAGLQQIKVLVRMHDGRVMSDGVVSWDPFDQSSTSTECSASTPSLSVGAAAQQAQEAVCVACSLLYS